MKKALMRHFIGARIVAIFPHETTDARRLPALCLMEVPKPRSLLMALLAVDVLTILLSRVVLSPSISQKWSSDLSWEKLLFKET